MKQRRQSMQCDAVPPSPQVAREAEGAKLLQSLQPQVGARQPSWCMAGGPAIFAKLAERAQAAADSQFAQDRVIALDEGGRAVTSEGMARLIAEVRASLQNMHRLHIRMLVTWDNAEATHMCAETHTAPVARDRQVTRVRVAWSVASAVPSASRRCLFSCAIVCGPIIVVCWLDCP
jgi:hypothetical protein